MATVADAQAELNAATGAWNRRDMEATSIRLDLFWKAKSAAWSSDPAIQRQLTLMDADAHSIWARMEDLKSIQADTGSAERSQHAQTAAQAWAKVAELKAQAGASAGSIATYKRLARASADAPSWLDQQIIDASYGAAFKAQAEKVAGGIFGSSFLGVPMWAWVAGAGILVLAVASSRK